MCIVMYCDQHLSLEIQGYQPSGIPDVGVAVVDGAVTFLESNFERLIICVLLINSNTV